MNKQWQTRTRYIKMNLAETIYQKSLDLPEDKAFEVIDFIDFIKSRVRPVEAVQQTSPLLTESLIKEDVEWGLHGDD